MTYAKTLKRAIDNAEPATGMTRTEVEAAIAGISRQLVGPIGNAERIMLCADRAALRKALAP